MGLSLSHGHALLDGPRAADFCTPLVLVHEPCPWLWHFAPSLKYWYFQIGKPIRGHVDRELNRIAPLSARAISEMKTASRDYEIRPVEKLASGAIAGICGTLA